MRTLRHFLEPTQEQGDHAFGCSNSFVLIHGFVQSSPGNQELLHNSQGFDFVEPYDKSVFVRTPYEASEISQLRSKPP